MALSSHSLTSATAPASLPRRRLLTGSASALAAAGLATFTTGTLVS